MPEAGGINDQPAAWREDIETLNAYYSQVVDRLIRENPDRYSRRRRAGGADEFTGFDSADDVRDWEGLFDG